MFVNIISALILITIVLFFVFPPAALISILLIVFVCIKAAKYAKRERTNEVSVQDITTECDFEDKYEKAIERWRDKIVDAEPQMFEFENPDMQISAYEKVLALCKSFKEFCESHPGGSTYYINNESDTEERIYNNLHDYRMNHYDTLKNEWVSAQNKTRTPEKAKTKTSNTVNLISSADAQIEFTKLREEMKNGVITVEEFNEKAKQLVENMEN